MLLLAIGGCAERVIPVFEPVATGQVKPGGPRCALVMLPNGGMASVYLHFVYGAGRIAISKVGIVNHDPEKVRVFFTAAQVYVDDGQPLALVTCRDFDGRTNNVDFYLLRGLPQGAVGQWLIPKRRYVRQSRLRGPTITLPYSVNGCAGFIKVRYRPIWGIAD